ncbi:MAG: hypothetical protein AVDCRST_MAG79-576, partial [uncultured Thermoleophilia bacterium]
GRCPAPTGRDRAPSARPDGGALAAGRRRGRPRGRAAGAGSDGRARGA